ENLAAFAEGLLLLITAAYIAFEAVRRLVGGGPAVNPAGYAFGLLIAALVIEAGRAAVLRRVGKFASSEALLADATNRLADVLATVGVIAGLIGVRLGLRGAEPHRRRQHRHRPHALGRGRERARRGRQGPRALGAAGARPCGVRGGTEAGRRPCREDSRCGRAERRRARSAQRDGGA